LVARHRILEFEFGPQKRSPPPLLFVEVQPRNGVASFNFAGQPEIKLVCFQYVFTVILALALGEAFKQFVAEGRAKRPDYPLGQTFCSIEFPATDLPVFSGDEPIFFFDL
jgi:hypothetical protein